MTTTLAVLHHGTWSSIWLASVSDAEVVAEGTTLVKARYYADDGEDPGRARRRVATLCPSRS